MAVQLTDDQIRALLDEPKPLPENYWDRLQLRAKRGHKERELDVVGAIGSEFRLILRQSNFNPLDFSIVLAYRLPNTTQLFRLRRHNGKSHQHTNKIERQTFYGFHVHQATERYQQDSGLREDGFAAITDRYSDFQSALDCMLRDGNFREPATEQERLF